MNLLTIAIKNIRQRFLASSLTSLSVALGVMLMVIVLIANAIVEESFSQNAVGYDLIVGRKGSGNQLVLSAIYRMGKPVDNLPYQYYKDLKNKKNLIEEAIPFTIGDFTEQGAFPIVGTISRYFELEYAEGKEFSMKKGGERLQGNFDAIIGSQVAKTNNWDKGAEFKLVHGGAESDHVHDEKFKVVGVLAPTGTANDRTVFIQLEGFYQIAGHEKPPAEAIQQLRQFYGKPSLSKTELAAEVKRITKGDSHDHHDHDHGHHHAHNVPDELKEVTAVLVKMKSQIAANVWRGQVKKEYKVQAVNPVELMMSLKRTFVNPTRYLLMGLTSIIVIVSGVSIFVSIYNSMADRKREIAIMRALGAQRQTVFSIILTESIILCVCGGILGIILGHLLVVIANPLAESFFKMVIDPWMFDWKELILLPVMILLASLVGFVPSLTAYRTDVAETLSE